MTHPPGMPGSGRDPAAREVLAIVVGAHLRAEVEDRPIAAELREALCALAGPGFPLIPLVMTDLWYLNTVALRGQPTVSVGRPEVNALAAFLADKLPSALAVDDRWLIQLDPELIEPVASCWGIDRDGSASAVGAFVDRWARPFLTAAARLVEGER